MYIRLQVKQIYVHVHKITSELIPSQQQDVDPTLVHGWYGVERRSWHANVRPTNVFMKKEIKSTYYGVINVRPSTDAGPTTRGRRLVNGQ
jgi:hypothetical protein